MMPMEPEKLVSSVRPFFVIRFFSDSPKEVFRDMEGFLRFVLSRCLSRSSSASRSRSSAPRGMESSVTRPSSIRMMRVEYRSASSGLWVTMITSRSRAISLRISIT